MKKIIILTMLFFAMVTVKAQHYKSISSTVSLKKEKSVSKFCSLTIAQTFDYLTEYSPFNLGNHGNVNFTKRFDYARNTWVENEVNISEGLGSNSKLRGQYKVINRNTIKIDGLRVTGGMFDASRNRDIYGTFTINCNGDIEGYLKDNEGNSKDILIKKNKH